MLKCVTITGADDGIQPRQLFELSKEFPFVEWGILFSKKQRGNPRFPSSDWLDVLGTDYYELTERVPPAQFSLHLCGYYVRQLIQGFDDFASDIGADLFEIFKRIQVNTHGENLEWDLTALASIISSYPDKEFIFQLDGNPHNEAMIRQLSSTHNLTNIAFLMDTSHGAGISPEEWLMPPISTVATGYAGGLGADNIEEQYLKIKEVIDSRTDFANNWWVDMETKVRVLMVDHEVFSPDKVKEVLQIANKWYQVFRDTSGKVGYTQDKIKWIVLGNGDVDGK